MGSKETARMKDRKRGLKSGWNVSERHHWVETRQRVGSLPPVHPLVHQSYLRV